MLNLRRSKFGQPLAQVVFGGWMLLILAPWTATGSHGKRSAAKEQAATEPSYKFRKTSSRNVPLDLLEEFRKDYPAAVDLGWLSHKDAQWYRVRGYNLGQNFTATYRNRQRIAFAVLEKPELLESGLKELLQTEYSDWECLGFVRPVSANKVLEHRILLSRRDRREILIWTLPSVPDAASPSNPNRNSVRLGRRTFARLKDASFRLQVLAYGWGPLNPLP